MKQSGIYQIRNTTNNKIYVGYSNNIQHRWCQHRSYLRRGKHNNIYLQRAWDRDLERNFVLEILELCSVEELATREHYWVTFLRSSDPIIGYNTQLTSQVGKPVISDSTRALMSKCRVGKKLSKETRQRMSASHKANNYKRSAETRMKISISNSGKIRSNETKEKLSLLGIGRKASEQSRANMSKAQKGKEKLNRIKKKVLDAATGIIYYSVTDAARELNVNRSNLYRKLRGTINNNTTLQYLNEEKSKKNT